MKHYNLYFRVFAIVGVGWWFVSVGRVGVGVGPTAGEADKEAAVLVTASAFLKVLNHLVGLQWCWWEE